MQNNLYQITLALAGMVQTTSLAKDLAQTGKVDEEAFSTSVYSIFQTDPKSISAVFGGIENLKLGLQNLIDLFNPASKKTRLQMRYLLSLIQMQKKIMRHAKTRRKLQQRLQQASKQVDYFSLTHPTVITNLADIYLDAISPFHFRVLIWGNQRVLTVNENMEKIRALLLAGVRAAVLWRQVGGSRLQLLFLRSKIKTIAEKILVEIQQHSVK
jgi:high frequency lysogenization protein